MSFSVVTAEEGLTRDPGVMHTHTPTHTHTGVCISLARHSYQWVSKLFLQRPLCEDRAVVVDTFAATVYKEQFGSYRTGAVVIDGHTVSNQHQFHMVAENRKHSNLNTFLCSTPKAPRPPVWEPVS